MPAEQTSRVLRLFVSSPGDVGEERAIVHELLDRELKYDPAFRGKISFEVVSWDNPISPTPMTARLTPQEAVHRFRGKPSDCDVVIVILWSRLGTHLVIDGKPYLSGTEYEYEEAANAESSPEILVYRRTEKVLLDADDLEFDLNREQRQNALAFFDRFKNPNGSFRGGFNEYTTPTDFKELLEKNLREILTERLQAGSVAQLAVASVEAPIWPGEPYPGLRAFTSDEAAIFFGRGRETDAIVSELRKPSRRFTAVVGASGSGKSSLVYAGLLPRLAEGAIEGSAVWRTLCFKPGAFGDNPFLALAAALKPLLPPGDRSEPIAIAHALAKAPDCISAYIDRTLAGAARSARLVLFADQAEEMFSQAAVSHRESFTDLLVEATGHPRVQVVLTMREDFLSQATSYPKLAAILQTGAFVLGAPGPAALADMIRRPALLAGFTIEEGLADEILKDVGSEPGALPLVAFCLEALYRSSISARHLTLKAYEDLGRLEGAIRGRVAELLMPQEGLDLETALTKLFRLLVHVDAAGRVSRRRAFRDELTADPLLQRVIEELVQGRLLVADDPDRATISLAHEVLLYAWPDLNLWLQHHRAELQRIDRVLSSVESANFLDRNYAVQALGEIGPAVPEAVPALITALGDADPIVRVSAANALGRIGPAAAEAVPALCTSLADGDEILQTHAASALAQIGPPAVPALIAALGDANECLRENAAGALWQIGAPAVPALITALENGHEGVRQRATEALGSIEPPPVEGVPALIVALADTNGSVRRSAASALGRIGPAAAVAVPALATALGDADASVRMSAAEALGRIGPAAEAGVSALIVALADTDEFGPLRQRAADALGRIGPAAAKAVPALTAAFGQETLRARAAEALGRIGPAAAEAVPALITVLGATDRSTSFIAMDALQQIGPEAVPALITAVGVADQSVRLMAAVTLQRIGPEAVPALIAAMNDGNPTLRRRAADALGRIGPPAADAVPALITALNGTDLGLRWSAAEALGAIGPAAAKAVPALIAAVRYGRRRALGDFSQSLRNTRLPAEKVMAPLVSLIEKYSSDFGSEELRRSAARALGQIGPPAVEAVPTLMAARDKGSEEVRRAAEVALRVIRPAMGG